LIETVRCGCSREERVFINARDHLFAINASTGKAVASFGTSGAVDLTHDLGRPIDRLDFISTSPPDVFEV
jgi:glucose dehydrogenase